MKANLASLMKEFGLEDKKNFSSGWQKEYSDFIDILESMKKIDPLVTPKQFLQTLVNADKRG